MSFNAFRIFYICKNFPFAGKTNLKKQKDVRLKALKIKSSEHIVVFFKTFLCFFNTFDRSDVLGKSIDGCLQPSMFRFSAFQRTSKVLINFKIDGVENRKQTKNCFHNNSRFREYRLYSKTGCFTNNIVASQNFASKRASLFPTKSFEGIFQGLFVPFNVGSHSISQ